jgi:DNA-binding CsgD family transcriptional regulator
MDARRGPNTDAHSGGRVDLSRWPLIGRDDELALATAALASSGCVVLTGSAGVGKTKLAHEVLARVQRADDRTEWIAATHSAATVPLGAVARLVPDATIGRGRDATLRSIVRVLREENDTRLLLGVDDAHLLDDASATLVHLLVTGGTAAAVVTVRSGEPAPDAIAALWKDGDARLVALQELARSEVETLVTTVLHDAIDGATLRFLWETSRGNALLLRELVCHGVESDALRREDGMWRWQGQLEVGDRLQAVVAMRMGTLDEGERPALELLAVGEPLSVECVRRLNITDAAAQLELRGLVTARSREGEVRLAHPLFGEVVRAAMPGTRRAEVQLELADAVEATCDGSSAEQFRVALWRVDSGDYTRPKQMRAAAVRAMRLWEPVAAERLARAALVAGPDAEASHLLGAALMDQNRPVEALDVFRVARDLADSDALRALVAIDLAAALSHQLRRPSDAQRILDEALDQVIDPDARARIEASRAAMVVSAGYATTGAAETLADVPTGALAAVIEHATKGHFNLAAHLASEWLATAPTWTEDYPTIELYFQLAQSWTLVLSGYITEAQVRADAGYADALEARAEYPRLTWSFLRGLIFVTRGLPQSAMRALQEAAGGLDVIDRGFLRPSHAYFAMASALAGEPENSEGHLRAAESAQPGFDGLFGIDVARAYAWVKAARGELTAAADAAVRVACDANTRQTYGLEVLALHDAARFGRAAHVVDRLEILTELVDGALVESVAVHARALVEQDGPALDTVSRSFSSLGLDLFAAEASAAAAAIHQREGKPSRVYAAHQRAHELVTSAESPWTPALRQADQPIELTAREREVATLGANDLTSREIATRLGISTRTVDNLLGRVYTKLGVTGRQELAQVLGSARGDR